jgi:hypothetical protein
MAKSEMADATAQSRHIDAASDIERAHDEKVVDDSASANFSIDEDALPPGYFRSRFFLGSMTGIGLGLMAGVAGFGYAAPILGNINADIGPVRAFLCPRRPPFF